MINFYSHLMRKSFVVIFIIFTGLKAQSQNRFVCFENDSIKNIRISVCFDKNDKAKYVKYQGQKDSIVIYYKNAHYTKNDGIPNYYWSKTYIEKYNGRITGEYVFTNAGTYQLDVYYTRKKDGKEFYFKVTEENTSADEFPYRSSPCW